LQWPLQRYGRGGEPGARQTIETTMIEALNSVRLENLRFPYGKTLIPNVTRVKGGLSEMNKAIFLKIPSFTLTFRK